MDWLTVAFDHVKDAAVTPLALVAYALAVIGGTILSFQIARNTSRQKVLDSLPPAERNDRAREIIGQPIPASMTAEEWLRHQRQKLLFGGFAIICLTLVAIVAIAAWTKDIRGWGPEPVPPPGNGMEPPGNGTDPLPPPPEPAPVPPDIAMLDVVRLKADRGFIHQKLGAPDWQSATAVAGMPVEIYVRPAYYLTIGYGPEGAVAIFSIVAASPAMLAAGTDITAAFHRTFADLKRPDHLAGDWSAKFVYYAEGTIGGSEADGYTTDGYFFTSSGYDQQAGTDGPIPPLDKISALSSGTPVSNDADIVAWRTWLKPNGYIRARSDLTIDPFFFLDYDWLISVPR